MSENEFETESNPTDEFEDRTGATAEEERANTVTFKRSHLYSVLLPLAFAAGLMFGYIVWGRDLPQETATPQAAAVPQNGGQPAPPAEPQGVEPTPEFRRYDVPEDDDPVWGSPEAPITIIEFSDYECPYCRKWHLEVWPQLQETYSDQIRLVYRDFPLGNMHANAAPAAEAANCALEQDMFWPYSEKLYLMTRNLGKSTYQSYAEELGLDMQAFNACLESGKYLDEVQADFEFATNLGIRSTPTFFVNGIPVVGAQPFEVFQTIIEKELAGELPQ